MNTNELIIKAYMVKNTTWGYTIPTVYTVKESAEHAVDALKKNGEKNGEEYILEEVTIFNA